MMCPAIGVRSQAFAKASGSDDKAKGIYITLRAKQLIREHSFTRQLLHNFAWFWCLSTIVTVTVCIWVTFLEEKRAFLNSDPVLTMQIPGRAPGPNRLVSLYRQHYPNDTRSDDDITLDLSTSLTNDFNKFPDAVADFQRIRKSTLLLTAPQFEDVFNLIDLSRAIGRSFTVIAVPTLIASISRWKSKIKPTQFISVWLVAWLLVVAAQIIVNLQTN